MTLPFQYIPFLWSLLLIPIIVVIYFYAKHKKKAVFKKLGDEALVKELTSNYNTSSFPIKFALVLVAMALVLISIANLRTPEGGQNVTRNGIDIMIALDVSKSMLAQDVKPNRLDRAKQLLNKLIDKLSNDRIGIIVFAGRAYLQMPLTADHSATKMYLAAATPETVPTQGTVISDALNTCNAAFNAKEKKYKAVILISDGEDHDENALKTAGEMAADGVVINTVGIGSPDGSQILDELTKEPKVDNDGNIVITKLNEQILADIANKGNGTYQLYSNADAVATGLYDTLATLDKRSVKDDSLFNYKSWFQYLLAAALLFLILELFVSEIKNVKASKMKVTTALFLICFSLPSFAQQAENGIIKKGNDAYKVNDFETAVKKYAEVVQKNDANNTAQFNLGNALYKSDKKDDAVNAFDKAVSTMKSPVDKSKALYNKAVVLQNNKKLEESIAAYKSALKNDPKNADARHNLQLALKQQQQQQQKDNKKDKKKDKDPKDDKKDKKEKDDKKKDKQDQPKPTPSKISKKEAEQKLQALLQNEKKLQDKFHKNNSASPDRPLKDW
jgi:tetratricopeptide (TPR) repeat protein